ncbi:MAG: hypothetical protein IPI49_30365 [Myxococcales bacterium]|nr:hypothetical protein [Myxococcales bacterium]
MYARTLPIGGIAIELPCLFPSVSSVKTNLPPLEYMQLLAASQAPLFLVSAYDIGTMSPADAATCRDVLLQVQARGSVVLLDSGNYERYWKADESWTPERYSTVLSSIPAPIAFSFDDQQPDPDPEHASAAILSHVARDQQSQRRITICPIVHGTAASIDVTVARVAEQLQPLVLAVAERELGDGILARATTIRRIRSTLDAVAPRTALHVLGTGNPIALLVYSIAGGDSFDGLEWCQTCADPDTALLHHFQHRDLVRTEDIAKTCGLPYTHTTLFHNLLFFRSRMRRIRTALADRTHLTLLREYLPPLRAQLVLDALQV